MLTLLCDDEEEKPGNGCVLGLSVLLMQRELLREETSPNLVSVALSRRTGRERVCSWCAKVVCCFVVFPVRERHALVLY